MAFAQAYRWHRDEGMYDALLPHVHRAVAWMEEYGDLDGDGLIEFGDKSKDNVHITQQGWKDSHDSLHWANGDEVDGPIALVEVQGYAYAAYAWLADVAVLRGDAEWAVELRGKADRIREAVERLYWLPEAGFYAQALDGQKHPVDQISSNPGHLLYCGLPTPKRASLVAECLMRPDMLTRWGIRTLSTTMSRYNPMSYHNGSVWPHDNSLIMAGLARYGFTDESAAIAAALVRLSVHDPERRLSELYCGFDDADERLGPVNYPVSCRPQAWAAGCGPMILAAMLGIQPGDTPGTVAIPTVTAGAGIATTATIDGIQAGGQVWTARVADGAVSIEPAGSAS
jgi:glycogen debranching enzyme